MTTKKRAFTDTEVLDITFDELQRDFKRVQENLKSKAKTIRDRMDVVIKKIEKGDTRTVNSLGELQSSGYELDRLCSELRLYEEKLNLINSLRNAEEDK